MGVGLIHRTVPRSFSGCGWVFRLRSIMLFLVTVPFKVVIVYRCLGFPKLRLG